MKDLDFTAMDLILENAKLKLDLLAAEHKQKVKIKEVVRVETVYDPNEYFRHQTALIQQTCGALRDYRQSLVGLAGLAGQRTNYAFLTVYGGGDER